MAKITRDEFFDALDNGTRWVAAVSFDRTNKLPLDSKSVFRSTEELDEYLESGAAYPGQIVAVVLQSDTKFYGIDENITTVSLGSMDTSEFTNQLKTHLIDTYNYSISPSHDQATTPNYVKEAIDYTVGQINETLLSILNGGE